MTGKTHGRSIEEIQADEERELHAECTTLDQRELATVLAALRFWRRRGGGASPEEDIATDGDQVIALNWAEVDALAERMNMAEALRVLVTVRGGIVEVHASGAAVRVIDYDIDGHGDSRDVDGDRAAVTLGAHFEYGPEAERLWNACTAGGIRVGKATEEAL